MAFEAAVVIRAGSAALFVLLGLSLLVLARRSPGGVALAVLLVCFGASTLVSNLRTDAGATLVYLVFQAGIGPSALAVMLYLPRPLVSRERPAAIIGLAAGIAYLIGLLAFAPTPTIDGLRSALEAIGIPHALSLAYLIADVAYSVGLVALLVTVSARVAIEPPQDRKAWIRAGALVGLMGPYLVFLTASQNSAPWNPWTLAAMLILLAGLSIPWLVTAARTGRRSPVLIAMVWPAIGLFTYAYLGFPMNGPAARWDAFGVFGITRLVGWFIIIYAILRADLLGVPLPRIAVSRGALAAGALATLFIVAQVAQNFFSAEFGLLTGGIVAGAFLFAAAPLQRAMERLRESDAGISRDTRAPPAASAPNFASTAVAYKAAIRAAMRDGVVTRREERHLAEVARALGIDPVQAHELRDSVEDEIRGGGV